MKKRGLRRNIWFLLSGGTFVYSIFMRQWKYCWRNSTRNSFKALKSIHRFDGKKDIRAWLFTIAKNTYFSYYKKNHRRLCDLAVSNEKEVDHTRVDLTERLTRQEDAFTIHQFIRTMSEPYKEVFSLRVFGELSFLQIGKLFGKGDSWARVTYHRARK